MAHSPYFGTYTTFNTDDKKEAGILMGADCIVGDIYDIVVKVEDGRSVPWVQNRFGRIIGHIDDFNAVQNILFAQAKGWELHAILVTVLYSDEPKPGHYWCNIIVMCFDPAYSGAFRTFMKNIGRKVANGTHPTVDLGGQGAQKVIDTDGSWIPNTRVPRFTYRPGTAVVKEGITINERLIELARSRNVGCMVVGWAFIFFLVLLAVFAIVRLSGL